MLLVSQLKLPSRSYRAIGGIAAVLSQKSRFEVLEFITKTCFTLKLDILDLETRVTLTPQREISMTFINFFKIL